MNSVNIKLKDPVVSKLQAAKKKQLEKQILNQMRAAKQTPQDKMREKILQEQ